jgi:hypothetical protein
MEHVADGLRDQVDKLIVCGRAWPGIRRHGAFGWPECSAALCAAKRVR